MEFVKECNPLILIFDDEWLGRRLLTQMLRLEGYFAAEGGIEAAARILQTVIPKIVVLNLALPEDSSDLCRFCKWVDTATMRNVPLVVVGSHAELLPKAVVERAAAVLCKPVDLDDLVMTLNGLVDSAADGSKASRAPGPVARSGSSRIHVGAPWFGFATDPAKSD